MELRKNIREEKLISKLFEIQNLIVQEKNFIEVLKGYCENNLEYSDELNKIYPFISMVYDANQKVSNKAADAISTF